MMETVGEVIDRIQSVSRFGRKPKPVIYLDMETRSPHPLGQRVSANDILCMSIKVGDGPVQVVLPWEAACARGDWREADRLRAEMFDYIKRQHQLRYYEDLAWIDKSWLARKFLTFAAWARNICGRSQQRNED